MGAPTGATGSVPLKRPPSPLLWENSTKYRARLYEARREKANEELPYGLDLQVRLSIYVILQIERSAVSSQ